MSAPIQRGDREAPCISQAEVLRLLRIRNRATLAQLVRLGAVPRPVPPGGVRWLAADIERCMAEMPPTTAMDERG